MGQWLTTSIFLSKWMTTSILKLMEHNLNLKVNRRQPQFEGKWKTTSFFWKRKDDLSLLANRSLSPILAYGRRPQLFVHGRQPQCLFSKSFQLIHKCLRIHLIQEVLSISKLIGPNHNPMACQPSHPNMSKISRRWKMDDDHSSP